MNALEILQVHTDPSGICTLRLNRPERHNALDLSLILSLRTALTSAIDNPQVRVIVLRGTGNSFCTGLDLKWIHSLLGESSNENIKELEKFAELLQALQACSKPTIAGVQGSCFGGGLGLLACCDLAIAGDRARFALPELRLGLVPFIISDCVTAAIGIRQFRRLGLTGETIGGDEALNIGLIHHLVPDAKLDEFIMEQAKCALMTAPTAMARFKQLHNQHQPYAKAHSAAGNLIDLLQHSAEAREGISAFLEKRRASWQV